MFDHGNEDKSLYIQKRFPLTDSEYDKINKQYGKLCWFAALKLSKSGNKTPEDLEDFHSEMNIGMYRAGSYYKRQTFIESIFEFFKDDSLKMSKKDLDTLFKLEELWLNKKAAFGEEEEDQIIEILERCKNLVKNKVPPSIDQPLITDEKFKTYCKSIIWNTHRCLGQQISRENLDRKGEISLDEWSFLGGGDVAVTNNICQNKEFQHDFRSIRAKIATHKDPRMIETFDIITDPKNYDSVFKQNENKGIKINVVRKQTRMSYRTINIMLEKIKKIIKKELGEEFN